jgi:hypothetical protein
VELMLIIGLIVLVAIGLQLWAIAAWEGWWRKLAAAPLLVVAGDILLILVQTSIDPTSHNLWPLELGMIAIFGAGAIAVLWLVRLVAKRFA